MLWDKRQLFGLFFSFSLFSLFLLVDYRTVANLAQLWSSSFPCARLQVATQSIHQSQDCYPQQLQQVYVTTIWLLVDKRIAARTSWNLKHQIIYILCIYLHIFIYIHIHIYIYILYITYIYTYIYIYIYILYIYTYILYIDINMYIYFKFVVN